MMTTKVLSRSLAEGTTWDEARVIVETAWLNQTLEDS